MPITHTWSIAQLERTLPEGGVIVAHWRVTAQDGDHMASAYGTAGLTPDPTLPEFVPFDKLTEADVLAWVWKRVKKDEIEAALASQIEVQKNPPIVAGVPW